MNQSVDLNQLLQQAAALQAAGRLADAESLCRQVLAIAPNNVAFLNQLGTIVLAVGRAGDAVAHFRRALQLAPGAAALYHNLGNALTEQGQIENAIESYRQALVLDERLVPTHCNLGNLLQQKGHVAEAIESFRRALAVDPNYAIAHNNLAGALERAGRLSEAAASYRAATTIAPDFPEAQSNFGRMLSRTGAIDEAILRCQHAIRVNPQLAEAHANLGESLRVAGRLDEALAACRRAIELRPNFPGAHADLGNVLAQQPGRAADAIAAFERAVALDPNYVSAHRNLGNAWLSAGFADEGVACYQRAIAIDPGLADVHSLTLLAMHLQLGKSSEAIGAASSEWDERHAAPLSRDPLPHRNTPDPDRRLRIGYVSADFCEHACARFLRPLYASHDRERFKIFTYANVKDADDITAWFRSSSDIWCATSAMDDDALADRIRADGIDILVDLKLHTDLNRLLVFARRPAPVQATWLGYPGTTGMRSIEYRLSDPHLDPPDGDDSVYSEKTVRLPDTFWCYDPMTTEHVVSPLPALASAGVVTFGSLNNVAKVGGDAIRLWVPLLREVPNSKLLLLAAPGIARERIKTLLTENGIDVDRVEFLAGMPRRDYLNVYHRIDVCLDPLPYNGHTTSLDAMWMGVPTVTMVGRTAMGRAGLSQLMNIGMPELIARTPEEFTRIAAELVADLPRLAELRASLRQRMETSPLMDAPRFARNIEAAYRQMWRDWCAGGQSART